jgi:hypothetical protein
MKKVILLVSFLVITLSLSLPAFADSFWSYSSISSAKGVMKDANGFTMKAKATLNYNVLGSGPQTPIKYSIDQLVFHLSDDASSFVDTDISISGTVEPSGHAFTLTGGMQGGALTVNHTSTVTASFSSTESQAFSFTDGLDSMSGDGLMTSIAEGTLIEIFKKGHAPGAKINMTFRFVGKLEPLGGFSNDPALITVTLSGTVPEITP